MSWIVPTLARMAQQIVSLLVSIWSKPQEAIDCGEVLPIIVKFTPGNITINIKVDPSWSIGELKVKLLDKLNQLEAIGETLSLCDISVIFAGKELSDKINLDDCGFGHYSVVHLINVKNKKINPNYDQPAENLVTTNFVTNFGESGTPRVRRNHFFIYCGECKTIKPGKLRVRCIKCKEGTLIVNRDPSQWDDVLIANRIPGTCHSDHCDGNFAEFYFKCSSDDHPYNETSALILPAIRLNSRDVPCLACTDILDVILIFPCSEGHSMCLNCFKNLCVSKLNERRFILDPIYGYTLSCPLRCPHSSIKDVHIFRLMEPHDYQRYQTFAAEECLLKDGGFFCPQIDCGAGILVEELDGEEKAEESLKTVICHFCQTSLCPRCKRKSHNGSCHRLDPWPTISTAFTETHYPDDGLSQDFDRFRWDNAQSLRTISMMTKPCPKCGVPTERNGGCMHMLCKCDFDWCWVCQSKWTHDCMSDHWFD